jgi:hypothetical protein
VGTAAHPNREAQTRDARPGPLGRLIENWHLLSLDAPTVAGLWAWCFAFTARRHLPWTSYAILCAGTWLVYISDRILDGVRLTHSSPLRARHYFYIRHRHRFLRLGLGVAFALVLLILFRMSPVARFEDTIVFSVAILYFAVIHLGGRRAEHWLPKELAVAVVFAAATIVPAWSLASTVRPVLLLYAVLFAALCFLNCVAIEEWENDSDDLEIRSTVLPHPLTQWAQRHLASISFEITGASLLLLSLALRARAGMAPAVCCSLSAALLFTFHICRRRFTILERRIAADAALLTPVLFLLFSWTR